jgi:uroporphyrinogen-III synthase
MIINTRPKSLSKNIIELSKDLGVDLNNLHLSEIKSLISEEKKIEWEPKLSKLNDYSNLIFTSQSSAAYGLEILASHINRSKINQKFICVGPATKKILSDQGINSFMPEKKSSKGILEMIKTNFYGKSLIFCGENSNRFLQDSLKEMIDEIVCYKPVFKKNELANIFEGRDIILISNFLTADFLLKNLKPKILAKKIFVVASERIKNKVLENFNDNIFDLCVANDSSDNAMLKKSLEFI